MKTNVLISSAALCKDCLFLTTGYGKKETDGVVFSEYVGKQGEWIRFGKGAKIEVLSESTLPLEPDKMVDVYFDGVSQGKAILAYNLDTRIITIMLVKTMIFGIEELRVAV